MITPEEAVCRIEAKSLDQLLHPTFDAESLKAGEVIGSALPASPGAAAGKVYFTAEEAKAAHEAGERVVLVRLETSPEDIEGMHASEGTPDSPRRYDISRSCCCPWYGNHAVYPDAAISRSTKKRNGSH